MKIAIWISLGLLLVSIALCLIFLKKGFSKATKITTALIMPLLGALSTTALCLSLPDSSHIILLSALAYIFCSASIILFYYADITKCRIVARILYLIAITAWFELFRSTFFIYRTPLLVIIIAAVIYLALFVLTCIFLGKQQLSRYFWTFISISLCILLHFSSVVTLIQGRTLYSIFLFLGTTAIFGLVMFYLIAYKKELGKNSRLIQISLMILSQLFISLACFLMIN